VDKRTEAKAKSENGLELIKVVVGKVGGERRRCSSPHHLDQ
jgi:hypothetical protein